MKKFSFHNIKNPKTLALLCAIPLLFIMCREQEKHAERNNLDNQISALNKEISNTQNLRTAPVPQNLQSTQSRYNRAADSVDNRADTIGACMMQNEDLILFAFNNYAVRVGRDFQMSKFLPSNDIATLQKYIANLDSTDFVQDMARARILDNMGSMHDLSYFLELLDFDSINMELTNKLAWNFYTDTNDNDITEISSLEFENPVLNNALNNEKNLLNRAWQKNYMHARLHTVDSLRAIDITNAVDSAQCEQTNAKYDSLRNQIINEFDDMDEYVPNFDIPEFNSVRTQYMHNDSLIREYYQTFDNMLNAEDTLLQYKQTIMRKRDSLAQTRQNLER